ncbi:MAG: TRAP transporter fused permease subunit [Rhodospirillales bacterium]|nr:MAG: TRAP transporter fused permease subunit [Rhodospirillales bacterium]
MAGQQPETAPTSESSDKDFQDIVAEAETGARSPRGLAAAVLLAVPFLWSLFQLWYASPLPFMFGFAILNDTEARSIHLAFAVFLAYLAYPAFKRSPRHHIPVQDWVFAAVGAFCAAYLFLFYAELSRRPGLPTTTDLVVAVTGMILLLEATRRALGPPLMVVAAVFLFYTFAGPHMPDVIAHKGQSLQRVMSHQWLSTEGVYGVALGVSTGFVFLFVLFGALLEKAGAGAYFIKVAFSLLGHLRGGPAKAAVVSSGMTGLISGSSIANVVTTGTFTIPLMKKVGFRAEKAGAIEVASSTNGQITPPVMGAAAFLMVEYVGISYVEVIKHAFLPAIISYIALVYIVHLEALKAGMEGLPRRRPSTLARTAITTVATIGGVIILSGVVYYGLGWVKDVFGPASASIATGLLVLAYIGLVWWGARFPDPDLAPTSDMTELPDPGPTVKSGLYFLLPVLVLVWCLVVERLSPGLSAFWATVFMIFVAATHRPLKALIRGDSAWADEISRGIGDLLSGMVAGGRNMIGIGVATAAAGIVVGTVTLTGIGLVMTEFVEFISGGNLLLMLIFTAVISLVLGMGLPTTANYIVVSTLMAPVIVTLGAQHGLIVPLIAVHLFVFYFGILADDTPPVGLAAFAAAAISGGDPIRTGIQGFTYDMRTAILPFMFIFNTELLLIGIVNWLHLAVTVFGALVAMLTFAAATQGFFLVRSRAWETAALLIVAFTLLRPGFWMDMIVPPLEAIDPVEIERIAQEMPPDSSMRVVVEGDTIDGVFVTRTVQLPLGPEAPAAQRLLHAGIEIRKENDQVFVDNIVFGGPAERAGVDWDWEVRTIQVERERLPKHLMFLPALALLAVVIVVQRRRSRRALAAPAVA